MKKQRIDDMIKSESAINDCLDVLENIKNQNLKYKIWPSENALIDRITERKNDLADAFFEIHSKLNGDKAKIYIFFETALGATVWHGPEKSKDARQDAKALEECNQEIAQSAQRLAKMLRRRSELNNKVYYYTETYYCVIDALIAAGQPNGYFKSYVEENIQALKSQFDSKYWPTIEEMLHELSRDADEAVISPNSPIVAVATDSSRPSKTDFIRALFAALEQNSTHFPGGFTPSDSTVSALANVLLDLPAEELFSPENIKQIRHRSRKKAI